MNELVVGASLQGQPRRARVGCSECLWMHQGSVPKDGWCIVFHHGTVKSGGGGRPACRVWQADDRGQVTTGLVVTPPVEATAELRSHEQRLQRVVEVARGASVYQPSQRRCRRQLCRGPIFFSAPSTLQCGCRFSPRRQNKTAPLSVSPPRAPSAPPALPSRGRGWPPIFAPAIPTLNLLPWAPEKCMARLNGHPDRDHPPVRAPGTSDDAGPADRSPTPAARAPALHRISYHLRRAVYLISEPTENAARASNAPPIFRQRRIAPKTFLLSRASISSPIFSSSAVFPYLTAKWLSPTPCG